MEFVPVDPFADPEPTPDLPIEHGERVSWVVRDANDPSVLYSDEINHYQAMRVRAEEQDTGIDTVVTRAGEMKGPIVTVMLRDNLNMAEPVRVDITPAIERMDMQGVVDLMGDYWWDGPAATKLVETMVAQGDPRAERISNISKGHEKSGIIRPEDNGAFVKVDLNMDSLMAWAEANDAELHSELEYRNRDYAPHYAS